MIRPVLQLPNPVLGAPCAPVGSVNAAARAVAQDLLDIKYLRQARILGIAIEAGKAGYEPAALAFG